MSKRTNGKINQFVRRWIREQNGSCLIKLGFYHVTLIYRNVLKKLDLTRDHHALALIRRSAFLILGSPLRHSTENEYDKEKDIFQW